MAQFKIAVARIERINPSAAGEDVLLTFRFERGSIGFEVPVILKSGEFDDTEIVQVARSRLSEIFRELARQSEVWKLSHDDLGALAKLNLRPAFKK